MQSLNKNGKRSEKTFNNTISTSDASFHFGREAREDEIEGIIGRKLTEEEIRSTANPYVRNHIFCSSCEKRLSYAESLFNEKLYKELKRLPKEITGAKFGDAGLFKLFWLSIIWRCSIARLHQDFSLPANVEERLRQLIDLSLGANMKETDELIKKNEEGLSSEIIGVMFANDIENPTGAFVNCESRLGEPYMLVINEFYLAYFENADDLQVKIGKIRGVKKELSAVEFVTSKGEDPKVVMLNRAEYVELFEFFRDLLVDQKLDFAKERFASAFMVLTGRVASPEKVQKFLHRFVSNHGGRYDKYTIEALKEAIKGEIQAGLD